MNVRNEVKSHLVCEGMTMQDVLGKLEQQYGWSRSISNLSGMRLIIFFPGHHLLRSLTVYFFFLFF